MYINRNIKKGIQNSITEWLFPPSIYCISCGNIIDGSRPYSLCDDCIQSIHWVRGSTCKKCGKPLAESANERICSDCAEASHVFDAGFACVEYGSCKHLVHGFKYGGRSYYGESMAQIMYDRMIDELPAVDAVLPVPMFPLKQKRRGYNQADVIGMLLAGMLGLPYYKDFLLRKRDTGAMSRLKLSERAGNLKGAFGISPDQADYTSGKRFLIIDDIYTTGSTMDECARVLKSAGAACVSFVVFAAGSDGDGQPASSLQGA